MKHRPAPRYRRPATARRAPAISSRRMLMHPDAHKGTRSLSIDSVITSFVPPHVVTVLFYSSGHRLNTWAVVEDSLAARGILDGDLVLYDSARKRPEDGAIMLVDERIDPATAWPVLRVCRVTASGAVEFHAAEGFPILNGERKVYGTMAALVRCNEYAEDGR